MKIKNKIITIVLILVVIFSALYFIPLRRNIDILVPCMLWNIEDPSVGECEGLEITGKYYGYLIKQDRFKGTVRISEVNDDVEIVNEMELNFNNADNCKWSSLVYFAEGKSIFMGSLFMQGVFEDILICLHMDNNSPYKGLYVTAPAANMEEAVAIAEAMNFA